MARSLVNLCLWGIMLVHAFALCHLPLPGDRVSHCGTAERTAMADSVESDGATACVPGAANQSHESDGSTCQAHKVELKDLAKLDVATPVVVEHLPPPGDCSPLVVLGLPERASVNPEVGQRLPLLV